MNKNLYYMNINKINENSFISSSIFKYMIIVIYKVYSIIFNQFYCCYYLFLNILLFFY